MDRIHSSRLFLMAAAGGLSFALASCASVSSHADSNGSVHDGLAYYLPLKDVKITVTVAKDNTKTATVEPTAAYPDVSRRFVARYNRNQVGKNTLDLTTDEKGLLKSSTATSVSQLGESLTKLASSAAHLRYMTASAEDDKEKVKPKCEVERTYETLIQPGQSPIDDFCGVRISIASHKGLAQAEGASPSDGETNGDSPTKADSWPPSKGKADGIYYRQLYPYLVTVEPKGDQIETFLVFLPNPNQVDILPVNKAVFSTTNKSEFTFVDGMPTKYKQEMEGEVVALFTLPAEILKAYFDAVSEMWTKRTTAVEDQTSYLEAQAALVLAQQKVAVCMRAVASNDDAKIQASCQ